MNKNQKIGRLLPLASRKASMCAAVVVPLLAWGTANAALDSNTDRLVFAQTDPTAPSNEQRIVALKNNGSSVMTVTSHDFIEGGGLGFIATDGCDGAIVEPGQTCQASFQWQPLSKGVRNALYQWSSDQGDQITVLLTNRFVQSAQQESQRRLPPVIERIDLFEIDADGSEIPVSSNALTPEGNYRMRWYSASYDTDTQTTVVLFNCGPQNTATNRCGDSFGGYLKYPDLATGTELTPAEAVELELATYNYQGNSAKHLAYSYDFHLNELNGISEPHKLVIRYYQKGGVDAQRGNSSISMMVPGGLSLLGQGKDTYFEPGGRRLQLPVVPMGETP